MDSHMTEEIARRLDGFPDDKIDYLLDYIEFLKLDETVKPEKRKTPPSSSYFLEAGP